MSRGQNTIKRSEVSTTPILLKYSASYDSSSFTENGITVNRGINSSFSTDGIQFLNYALVKQLYYQEYLTGSLLFSSSFWNPSLQSTAYGFAYGKDDGATDQDFRYFPKDANSEITVIGIPRTRFGEQISRNSFCISGSDYRLIDDGNGNILDTIITGSKYYSTFGAAYGVNGVRLYNPGYTTNLVGSYLSWNCPAIGGSYLGTFWANPYQNNTDGRLNSTGFWSAQSIYAIGKATLEFNVIAPSNGTYHIGIGSDNYSSVYVDDILVATEINDRTSHINFRYWLIFPVTLTVGSHKIRFEGVNNYDNPDNPTGEPGLVGIEIYNNTNTEISQSITTAPIGTSVPAGINMLYSSKDHLTEAVFSTKGHVGNILYSQGVVVITDKNYANVMIPIPGTTTTTTSTTSTTTTAAPTTTTTSTTTTSTTILVPTTTTTTSTTTVAPTTTTTSTTTSTTTAVPTTTTTTSTTTSTTTAAPTTTTTTTSTTTTTTSGAPNLFLEYQNATVGSQTWEVEYSIGAFANAVTITAANNVIAGTPTIVSMWSSGPLGVSGLTSLNIRVRKTSNSGNMIDTTGFTLSIDNGSGFSIVGSVNKTTGNNPIGPTAWTNITTDLGSPTISTGYRIRLAILEG